jgi:hypothetical protein
MYSPIRFRLARSTVTASITARSVLAGSSSSTSNMANSADRCER